MIFMCLGYIQGMVCLHFLLLFGPSREVEVRRAGHMRQGPTKVVAFQPRGPHAAMSEKRRESGCQFLFLSCVVDVSWIFFRCKKVGAQAAKDWAETSLVP